MLNNPTNQVSTNETIFSEFLSFILIRIQYFKLKGKLMKISLLSNFWLSDENYYKNKDKIMAIIPTLCCPTTFSFLQFTMVTLEETMTTQVIKYSVIFPV